MNDGQGGFRRENLPLDVETKLCNNIFQMWVDLDGDGQEELLTTELTAATSKSPSLKLYRTGPSGKLQQVPESPFRFEHLDAPRKPKFSHITVCDIEGDGDLDVLYGGWVYDDGFLLRKLDGDGAKNLLFVNEGDLKFTEQSVARGLVEYKQTLFTECFDFDQDGDMDVLFGNDFAGNGYFENDGRGHFVRNSAHAFNKDVGFTMGMGISDYDNQGEYSVYLANMYSHAGHRLRSLKKSTFEKDNRLLYKAANGNNLFEPSDKDWEDLAVSKGVHNGDWSWASVFFDADNDADKDLYVANGFLSLDEKDIPDH